MATVKSVEITDTQLENTVVDAERHTGVRRYFTIPGRDPFEEIEWEMRDAFIPGKDKPAFDQKGVEFPKFWSQTATNIVAQKYFRGRLGSPEREWSVRQMIGRVVSTIGSWGRAGEYFADEEEADTFEAELKAILVNQLASFNSPVWFNVGFEEKPQCSACFILSIDDSMESILDWIRREGVIFRGGSGSGVNLSRLRSSKEQLSKGGYASGPVSFMRGADASAGTIKSGGKTRRAAKMVVLDVDHPDIEEFIWCKAKEERKARVLEAAGYDMSLDSPDWASIQYQNANNSVRVTDAFMQAAEDAAEWNLNARTDGTVVDTVDARGLLREMADAAWQCADPGVQYDTTINAWHTCPNSGRINASNPCSEYMHLDDSACNLASLNLMKFRRDDGELDVEAFEHAVDVDVPRAGDPRRLLVVPDDRDRAQRAGLPRARPRLREPRRAADGAQPAVRLRRGARVRRGRDGAHDRPCLPQVGRDRLAHGPVRRLPAERGRHARRDREAPRSGRQHREHRLGAGRPALGSPQGLGRRARRRRGQRLPQLPGDRAGADRDDQLHDGLRHDGRRARLLAREVEEARRRRRDHDRQQDRADGAREARLRARGGRGDRRLHRRAQHRRRRAVREGRALPDLRLRDRRPRDPLLRPREDDGRRPAVHLRRHLEDREHAGDGHRRGGARPLRRRVEARREGDRHLPRQLQGRAAALIGRQGERRRARARRDARAAAAAGCPRTAPRSAGSSASASTRATSTSACSTTGRPATSSWTSRRRARRSPAS